MFRAGNGSPLVVALIEIIDADPLLARQSGLVQPIAFLLFSSRVRVPDIPLRLSTTLNAGLFIIQLKNIVLAHQLKGFDFLVALPIHYIVRLE
jgi:hypothetical protein